MERLTNKCCGCRSCEQKCPKDAISMVLDREGFLKARINAHKCIDCGLCRKVCPLENPIFHPKGTTARLFYHNDINWRMTASSSGAFEAVCRAWIADQKFSIFGCVLDGFCAYHMEIQDWSALPLLKKSKYVQSDTRNTFTMIKQRLAEGYKVVFAGTPCQVMGLTSFLGKSHENLLTIDFVCHGTPSPLALKKYAVSLSGKWRQPVTSLRFRHKHFDEKKGWSSLGMLATLAGGSQRHITDCECEYMMYFLCGVMSGYSCYTCPFATTARCSDVTLGDFWGVEKKYPELGSARTDGVSMLLLNSTKAEMLDLKLPIGDIRYEKVPIEMVTTDNRQLNAPSTQHSYRKFFYRDLHLVGFDGAVKWMTYGSPLIRLKRRIFKLFR